MVSLQEEGGGASASGDATEDYYAADPAQESGRSASAVEQSGTVHRDAGDPLADRSYSGSQAIPVREAPAN